MLLWERPLGGNSDWFSVMTKCNSLYRIVTFFDKRKLIANRNSFDKNVYLEYWKNREVENYVEINN